MSRATLKTLWDLVEKVGRADKVRNQPARSRVQAERAVPATNAQSDTNDQSKTKHQPVRVDARRSASVARYEAMQKTMLAQHNIRVRKWRSNTSGVAWQVMYADGTIARLIESPKPRGPVSAAVFLHEIGHHVIGFGTYKPRCLEEYHAWMYSLEQMKANNIAITERVEKRVRDSLRYAVAKAVRRGIKHVPVELLAYLPDGVEVSQEPPAEHTV